MAHELNFTNGVADFFEVGAQRSAWHREGILLPTAPSLDDALQIAKLDYTVERVSTSMAVDTIGGMKWVKTHACVTRRTDTGVELGTVTDKYVPVQNRDAFRSIEPLLDAGVLVLETGGVLRDGADAWLLGRFDLGKFGPICREVFGGEVVPYALIAANHSGRRGVLVQLTPIRVVCANTLGASEAAGAGEIIVAHTGDALGKVVAAAETLFKGIVERHEIIAANYRQLKSTILSSEQFSTLVLDVVQTDPRAHPSWNPEARMADAVVKRYEQKIERLRDLWVTGKGHVGDHSAWEAYNGVVEAIDHDRGLFPTRSGVYRTASLLTGTLGETKQAVLASLLTATA